MKIISSRVLIFGGTGLLGMELRHFFLSHKWQVFITGRKEPEQSIEYSKQFIQFFVGDDYDLKKIFAHIRPDLVVNCIALTDVDLCESEFQMSDQLHAHFPAVVARICSETSTRFLHISTDMLFGDEIRFNTEDTEPDPQNIYATTKLKGEKLVLNCNPNAIIVRTNFFCGSKGKKNSLLEFIHHSLITNADFCLYDDILFNPVSTKFLASAIINLSKTNYTGILNVSSDQMITKYEFGVLVASAFKLNPCFRKGRSPDRVAKRPKCMLLSNRRIKSVLNITSIDIKKQIIEMRM